MDIRPRIRNAALIGSLAAVAATAWATNESISSSAYTPPSYYIAADSTLAPTDEILAPADDAVVVPVVERSVAQPGIVIAERRLSTDERIQSEVMDRLASMPISGKIGVESNDSVVRLSGWTTTAGQADRAGRAAHVMGVRYVQNEIRPRIGGSAS